MQEWLRYIVEHNIPVYNVYMQCYYIGNVGRKMIIMDRTRRLRMNATLRDMVRENHVRVDELIYPVFVTEENDVIQEVPSMPGICQYSLDHVLEEIGRAVEVRLKRAWAGHRSRGARRKCPSRKSSPSRLLQSPISPSYDSELI